LLLREQHRHLVKTVFYNDVPFINTICCNDGG